MLIIIAGFAGALVGGILFWLIIRSAIRAAIGRELNL